MGTDRVHNNQTKMTWNWGANHGIDAAVWQQVWACCQVFYRGTGLRH